MELFLDVIKYTFRYSLSLFEIKLVFFLLSFINLFISISPYIKLLLNSNLLFSPNNFPFSYIKLEPENNKSVLLSFIPDDA